jgi:hypothetical protein
LEIEMTDIVVELRVNAKEARVAIGHHIKAGTVLRDERAADEIERLRAVNAEMLAELKRIVATDDAAMAELKAIGIEVEPATSAFTERARDVIAKAEGKS